MHKIGPINWKRLVLAVLLGPALGAFVAAVVIAIFSGGIVFFMAWILGAIFGYLGTLVFGIPAHLLLRYYFNIEHWIAYIIFGAMGGLVLMYIIETSLMAFAALGGAAIAGSCRWLLGPRQEIQNRTVPIETVFE